MSLELDTQKEINVLRDIVKSPPYTNLIKASKMEKISLILPQVLSIRSLLKPLTIQTFSNIRSGVNKVVSYRVSKI
jgi:hypothetical protein